MDIFTADYLRRWISGLVMNMVAHEHSIKCAVINADGIWIDLSYLLCCFQKKASSLKMLLWIGQWKTWPKFRCSEVPLAAENSSITQEWLIGFSPLTPIQLIRIANFHVQHTKKTKSELKLAWTKEKYIFLR